MNHSTQGWNLRVQSDKERERVTSGSYGVITRVRALERCGHQVSLQRLSSSGMSEGVQMMADHDDAHAFAWGAQLPLPPRTEIAHPPLPEHTVSTVRTWSLEVAYCRVTPKSLAVRRIREIMYREISQHVREGNPNRL